MLYPDLRRLSLLCPTGAKDDVVTEIRKEQQDALHEAWEAAEEEQALDPKLKELLAEWRAKEAALRENYRSERRTAPVRKAVFENDDLVREVLLALDNGDDSWEVCKLVTQWCSLNKARRAACNDDFYEDLGERIWGNIVHAWWLGVGPDDRFREMCKLEHAFRTGERTLQDNAYLRNVKRIVLAAIAADEPWVLSNTSVAMRDDEDVVRAAVSKNPLEIRYASLRLQGLINPLRPTFYWPLDTPSAPRPPTEFERQWGNAVLHILLFEDWTGLTIRKIRGILENKYPEVGPDYFGNPTHKMRLRRLVDWLMLHMRENIPRRYR